MRKGIWTAIAALSMMIVSAPVVSGNPVSPGNITEFSVDPDWIEVDFSYWSHFHQPFIVNHYCPNVEDGHCCNYKRDMQ